MNPNIISQGILKTIQRLVVILLIIYLLYLLKAILIYIFISVVLSLFGKPIILFLKKRLRFPNLLAVFTTLLFFLTILFTIFLLFIPIINQQGKNLILLNTAHIEEIFLTILLQINSHFNLSQFEWFQKFMDSHFIQNIDLSIFTDFFLGLFSAFSNFTIGLFAVLFITFFLLKDSTILKNTFFVFTKIDNKDRWIKSLDKIERLLSRYFIGLLLQITILFIFYAVLLLILGIENALIIAILCAIANIIPYIGPIIGFALMIFLGVTTYLNTDDFNTIIVSKITYLTIGYLVAQMIDNFFSQPIIFSNSVKSHPLEIFLIILIAGTLFGTIGLIVAIPIYTCLKVVCKEFFPKNKIIQALTSGI